MQSSIDYNTPYAGWKTWLTCALTGLFCFPACCPFDYHTPPAVILVQSTAAEDTSKDTNRGNPKLMF